MREHLPAGAVAVQGGRAMPPVHTVDIDGMEEAAVTGGAMAVPVQGIHPMAAGQEAVTRAVLIRVPVEIHGGRRRRIVQYRR